jgi:hypothetical protein
MGACVNYVLSTSPTDYYSIVWSWAEDGAHYSVYTKAVPRGQICIENWPYPRVRNIDFVHFTIDDTLTDDSRCARLRSPCEKVSQVAERILC